MSHSTEPPGRGPYSDPSRISIDHRVPSGRGSDAAKMLWWAILSHTPWEAPHRPTWANNHTLAADCSITMPDGAPRLQSVEYGLQRLREGGLLKTRTGKRPGARRPIGRILEPQITGFVQVKIPDRAAMANLWAMLRADGKRPGATVATMMGLSVLAGSPTKADRWPAVTLGPGALMRFMGTKGKTSHLRRIETLRSLDLVRWTGSGLAVAPTDHWRNGRVGVVGLDVPVGDRRPVSEPPRHFDDDDQWERIPW